MLEQSRLVVKLTPTEIQDLLSELNAVNNLWQPHSTPTALQHGKTVYLQQIDESTGNIKFSIFDKFPKTHAILQNIAGSEVLKRCYWHKLMPGDKIERHDDTDLPFVKNKMLAHRYQVYLDSDPNFILELDNKIVPTLQWEYSVVDFALEKTHFYHNKSNKPWMFLVFDTFHNN